MKLAELALAAFRSGRESHLVPQMSQRGLNVRLHLGVVSPRIRSKDCLDDELTGGKILPYGDAAGTPVTQGEA